ncbi:hypothetical protein [Solirubrobacter soli]|uniref:hypothetical protein n=1 Tax=Solirubrobacter soli TaxID=363832 RepID=UPI00040B64DA|nr:hypothetical protein [Solirubrobacter soli]
METPDFVATIEDAPAFPLTAEAPAAAAIAPTQEFRPPQREPDRARPARRSPRAGQSPRVMSRVLLAAIAAAIALYAAGIGGDLLGMIRGGASARTVPVEGGSLLRAVALEAALHGLPPGRVEALRVSADRIDARVVIDGHVRLVRITSRGWVTDLPAPEKPARRWVRVDARAPARIVRTVKQANVAYLLLDGARWQLVLDDGRQYSADRHGRTVRRG